MGESRKEDGRSGPEARDLLARPAVVEGSGTSALSRRTWLEMIGAGALLSACGGDERTPILPYARTPRELTPGVPRYFATSLLCDGFACGVLVESHDGRPTKIEGNPDHPASLGATTAWQQASVLGLYDPDRARAVRGPKGASTWDAVVATFGGARADRGAGLRLLLEPSSSPLVESLLAAVLARHPLCRVTFHAPAVTGNAEAGAEMMFGERLTPLVDLGEARSILTIDDDLFGLGPFAVRHAKRFAEGRRRGGAASNGNRLFAIEPELTITGSMADDRLRRRPSEIGWTTAALAAELTLGQGLLPKNAPLGLEAALAPFREVADRALIQALVEDLANGLSACSVGPRQPPVVHALGHLISAALESTGAGRGATKLLEPQLIGLPGAEQSLADLTTGLREGRVDTVIVVGGNPAYTAPADLDLAGALKRAARVLRVGLYEDETAEAAGWFGPALHDLESWGDARAFDGTISLVQPLALPLVDGRSLADILSMLAGSPHATAQRLLEERWARGHGDEASFRDALRRGVVGGSAATPVTRTMRHDGLIAALGELAKRESPAALELSFTTDARVQGGRFTNNPWLLELPAPLTRLTWENAVLLSPTTAARLELSTGDLVEVTSPTNSLRAPVLVAPGQADGVVSLSLGFGRRGAESIARGVGYDAYRSRSLAHPWWSRGAGLMRIAGARVELAIAQRELGQQGRPIALRIARGELRRDLESIARHRGPLPSLLTDDAAGFLQAKNQWAMTIDLGLCTGCAACVLACQAENNTPVVGKEEVARGREMHWLRIDTYFDGEAAEAKVIQQPMMCQHCEKAPCEYVCPVGATVHSGDGLNEMIYNRCVGTRFCSNNCPYKVRRFNWYDWQSHEPKNQGLVELQRNPDVTVRRRGVMEKCTYCVQRIRESEIHARLERRDLRPGEVVTACQQACPTEAIQFGSLAHASTPMVQGREGPRAYAVLDDLGTRPRTMYLARVDDPLKGRG